MFHELQAGRTSIKSIRLALQPVVGLMQALDHIPTQADVDQYLAVKQGQKAALTGFINHLNSSYGLQLVCQLNEQLIAEVRQQELKKIEQQMIDLTIKYRNDPTAFDQKLWVKTAMLYFHQVELKKGSKIEIKSNKCIIIQTDTRYIIPWIAHSGFLNIARS